MYNETSVIVCTRNRPEHLRKCIASLLKQSAKPKEIIIVDDASDERIDTMQMLNAIFSSIQNKVSNILSENIEIKYMRNKRRQGIVKSRNLGIAVAKGDVVAFIDDDGYAHKDWIKNLSKYYKRRSVVGVGGPVVEIGRNVETKSQFKRVSYITRHGDIKHNYRVRKFKDTKNLRVANVRFLMGGNMSFRRNALLNLDGFSTEYKGNYYREETDMCMRASKIGKIVFEPSVVTYHNTAKHGGTRDIMSMEKFFYWYFRNTVLLFLRHFDLSSALSKTWRQCKKYIKGAGGLIKTNRDYLIASMPIKIVLAIVTGTITGILIGLLFDKPLKKLMYKHPEYATLITIALMGTAFQIVDYRNIEIIIKHVDKL